MWDEEIYDESLRAMMEDTVRRVKQNDPAKGRWDVVGEEATVWVDASSLALGIVVEVEARSRGGRCELAAIRRFLLP